MANSLKNQKLSSKFPLKFNKREGKLTGGNNSLMVADTAFSLLSDDGINFVRGTAAITITLPPAAENKGRLITFLTDAANLLTIGQNTDSANIDGANADFTGLDAADDFLDLFCDGTEWIIVREFIA